ncbi:MAG: hypothetical protein NXI24_16775 [bacterium]|nr:hypothetical protein [bacterium]
MVRDADQVSAAMVVGQARWSTAAAGADGTYFYWRIKAASESGERLVTGVQVIRDQAARRYLTRSRIDHANDGAAKIFERREDSAAVARSRPNSGGYPPLTIDELYESCSKILPNDSASARAQQVDFELQIDSRGVPRACWALEKGCQGDCVTNFGVAGLVFRKLATDEVTHFLNTPNPDLR